MKLLEIVTGPCELVTQIASACTPPEFPTPEK